MPRYRISEEERDAIGSDIIRKRQESNEEPLREETLCKIVSLIHHLEKTCGKKIDDITNDDLTQYFRDSNYSLKTCQWQNNILARYYGIRANEINRHEGYSVGWFDNESLKTILSNMISCGYDNLSYEDMSTIIVILLIELCCQRDGVVQQLNIDNLRNLINGQVVEKNQHLFYLFNHLDFILVNDESLKTILRNLVSNIQDENFNLQKPSRSFLQQHMSERVRGMGFFEFFKHGRKAFNIHLAQTKTSQVVAIQLSELQKTGFKHNIEYLNFLLSQIQN